MSEIRQIFFKYFAGNTVKSNKCDPLLGGTTTENSAFIADDMYHVRIAVLQQSDHVEDVV